jgi:hypothetical protein
MQWWKGRGSPFAMATPVGRQPVSHGTLHIASFVILTLTVTDHSLSAQAKARAAARAGQYQVPAGTVVSLRLRTPIDSSSSQVNDQIDAVLTESITQEGVELVPNGSLVHGTILEVEPASRETPLGRISFAFAIVQHVGSGSRAPFRTRPITIEAERPASPASKRGKSKNQPIDVSWSAGHLVSATLAEPLLVAIPKSR